jgi:hypothetical protein
MRVKTVKHTIHSVCILRALFSGTIETFTFDKKGLLCQWDLLSGGVGNHARPARQWGSC